MMPLTLTRFSLISHPGEYKDWPTRTRLLDAGCATTIEIPGYVLRHQFEVEAGYLLVTDWDCPYEESTEFVLLDRQLRLRQRLSQNTPYSSWILDTMEPLDARRFRCAFGPEGPWILIVGAQLSMRRRHWLSLSRELASDP